MDKDLLYTIGGTILGALIEEGVEEIFPGVGELGWTGEISGAIAGFLGSQLTRDEARRSLENFIRFMYRSVNKVNAQTDISDDDLNVFSKSFGKLPVKIKKEIIGNFKKLAPYEYNFIADLLKGMEVA